MGFRFKVPGLGFGVHDLGIYGLGFRIQGFPV